MGYRAALSWDDLRIEPVARTTGPNAPSFVQVITNGAGSRGVYAYDFDNAAALSEKEVFFTKQFPHSWAGTPIGIHVHWMGGANENAVNVRWGLEYSWVNIEGNFPDTSLIYAPNQIAGRVNVVSRDHTINAFSLLTPSASQNGISSIMLGRLWRNSSDAADTYTGSAYLLYIDTHLEHDSTGSVAEYVK